MSGEPTSTASSESKVPGSSSAPTVGKTATRKRGNPQWVAAGDRQLHSPTNRKDVALLKAEGFSTQRVGKMLDLDVRMVSKIAKEPDVQAHIALLREQYRAVAQERGLATAGKMWDKLDLAVANDEAKKANLYAFGMSALDRISTNTSGEKQKVEVSGIPGEQNPKIEIRNLLVQLFGEPKPLSGN